LRRRRDGSSDCKNDNRRNLRVLQTEQKEEKEALSHHILPTSGTMIGVSTTLIGLVKIAESRTGQSHVDEYAALAALIFLVSALTSYTSIRSSASRPKLSVRLELIADQCFLIGLVALTLISVFFAYEVI
jgi:hypothetical protein